MSAVALCPERLGCWLADPGFGVYVHVPFCQHRCHYCDFNTYEGLDALFEPYVDALVADIARWPGHEPEATSVFFGGGTPTLLAPEQLARILEAVRDRFGLAPDAEVTIEANPETVDGRIFEGLLAAGFDRFSIGVQSLAPLVLERLGRTHPVEVALEAIAAARRAGVADLNVDLIYGSPWETAADWDLTLRGVVDAGPDHISTYSLTVEEGTPLHTLVATGRVADVDPDTQADRFEAADAYLPAAGYERYEISNWCRPGRASRHNLLYWSAGDYLGFGAGAHAHAAGHRWWNLRLPRDYIAALEQGRSVAAGEERLDGDARAGEALMLGLRLASGIDVAGFAARFGAATLEARAEAIEELVALSLLERSGGRLFVPGHARLVANDVLARLL